MYEFPALCSTVSEAYLNRRASRNVRGLSYGRFGRTNEAAVRDLLRPTYKVNTCQRRIWHKHDPRIIHWKYLTSFTDPSCFPLEGSSHSTPSHGPLVPCTSPTKRMVQRSPPKDRRWPM